MTRRQAATAVARDYDNAEWRLIEAARNLGPLDLKCPVQRMHYSPAPCGECNTCRLVVAIADFERVEALRIAIKEAKVARGVQRAA